MQVFGPRPTGLPKILTPPKKKGSTRLSRIQICGAIANHYAFCRLKLRLMKDTAQKLGLIGRRTIGPLEIAREVSCIQHLSQLFLWGT